MFGSQGLIANALSHSSRFDLLNAALMAGRQSESSVRHHRAVEAHKQII